MRKIIKSSVVVLGTICISATISGCVSVDENSEASAVKRLVKKEGQLDQNVDADFEGDAYDQNGDKVVCKKTRVTGSRIGQYTVCRSEAEWAATEDEVGRRLQRLQNAGASAGDKG